jgi:regulator of nucleoside diphosphate kinase
MPLPQIAIARADRDRLMSIATVALGSRGPTLAASTLLSELCRARIVQGTLPPHVVAVNSEVEIRDNVTNTDKRLRLVYPEDAETDSNSISVLTLLGAMLIGLSVGDTIEWCTPARDRNNITVLRTTPNGRSLD